MSLYGRHGCTTAQPNQRDALLAYLCSAAEALEGQAGCLFYLVSTDPANADAIWVSEVWQSAQAHADSLALPAVRALIAQARPLMAGMSGISEFSPVAGGRSLALEQP